MRRNQPRPTRLVLSVSGRVLQIFWSGVDQVASGNIDPETIGTRLFTVLLID